MAKWLLFTAYDSGFSSIAAQTVPTMQKFAKKFNLEFFEYVDLKIGLPPAWAKILLAKQKLDDGYEGIIWVDADAIIRRFDEDIRDHLRSGKDLYFVKEDQPIPGTPSKARLNTGVFMLRNSDVSRAFLQKCIEIGDRPEHEWWDQSAAISAFGFHSMFHTPETHKPDEPTEFSDSLYWLPKRWNVLIGSDIECDGIIHHYFGAGIESKLLRMHLDRVFDELSPRNLAVEKVFNEVAKVNMIWRRNVDGKMLDIDELHAAYTILKKRPWYKRLF